MPSPAPKYPNIRVKLSGKDGNAFSILGRVRKALKDNGLAEEEIAIFMEEATAGDYGQLIQVVVRWVTVI